MTDKSGPRFDPRLIMTVLDTMGALVVLLDTAGRIVYCNPACERVTGHTLTEVKGQDLWELLLIPEEREEVRSVLNELLQTASPNQHENYWRGKDGSLHLISWSNTVHREANGQAKYVIGIGIEITAFRQAQENLEDLNSRIILLHETAHRLEEVEREEEVYRLTIHAAEEILGFPVCTLDILEGDKFIPKATSTGLPPGASRAMSLSEQTLETKTYRAGRTYVLGRTDEDPSAQPTRPEFRSVISAPIGKFGVFQVVSERENAFSQQDVRLLELLLGHTTQAIERLRLQQQLREQALLDPLTGIYNRRYFNEIVETELVRSKRYDHPIGFLMIDVDRFKEINDRFGHQMGDRVLKSVADLLSDQVRQSDIVVRYGGDEFLIMLIETDGETEEVAERIRSAIAERNKTDEVIPFAVTLSIGAAHWVPESGTAIEQVLAEADRRMYAEKRSLHNG